LPQKKRNTALSLLITTQIWYPKNRKEIRMKITKVECMPLSLARKGGGMGSNVVLMKIHTDEGIMGVAEGGTCGQDSVMAAMKTMGKMLIGENPFDIAKILKKISRSFGNFNVVASATIDFALHDIKGKALGVPVYELLGGKACEKLAIGMMVSHGSPEERAEQCVALVEQGIRTFVCKVGPGWGNPSIFDDVANVRAIRKAVGDEIDVGVDANGGLDYTTALELGRRLEEFNLLKIEQPLPRWDFDGLGRLHRKLRAPISAHESAIEIPGLLECIKKDVCDSVCIKVVWSGGILNSVKWAAIAEAANLAISCGSMVGSSYEASAQANWLCSDPWMDKLGHANIGPPLLHNQWDTTNPPITTDLAKNPVVFKDGYFYPPDGPGLGLELNEELIPKIITQGMSPMTIE
jgi:L-alanine-DL-glutamate epimerase-like enolase superfamily enzyme